MERFPARTEADLFAWIWRHHRELPPAYRGRNLAETVDELMRQSRPSLVRWCSSALARLAGRPAEKDRR